MKKFKNKINNIYKKITKKIKRNRNKFSFKETITFMLITFLFGMIIGGVIMYGKGAFFKESDTLKEFIYTYNDIVNNYYEDINDKELLEKGLQGMLNYLGDPYSTYMDEENAKAFNETVEGNYCGIGTEILYEYETGISKINKVFEKSPAEKAGLKVDDILIKVDDVSLEGKNNDDIAKLVKGEKGTKVKITVKRNEEELSFDVIRDNVDIISVNSKTFENNGKKIGYLQLDVFADNTDEQFKDELEKLEKNKIDSLIIDVRGNSGGYLTTVNNILSFLIPKGKTLYQLKTKDEIEIVKDKTNDGRTYPIAVLADGASASASEVLTACLKETYGATVIGTKTFGKGKVQKSYQLSSGSLVKYTFQEWLTPKGNYIDQQGIEPTIEVKYIYEEEKEIDNQLQAAIDELSK